MRFRGSRVWFLQTWNGLPAYPPSGSHMMVGDTGIEPMTSSVSGKRATAAPIAHFIRRLRKELRMEVDTGFEPVYTALQAAASPLGQSTKSSTLQPVSRPHNIPTRADDEIRTRDPHLGKVMRYHCATSACAIFIALLNFSVPATRKQNPTPRARGSERTCNGGGELIR